MELVVTLVLFFHMAWFWNFLDNIDLDFRRHWAVLIEYYKGNRFYVFLYKGFEYIGIKLLKYSLLRTYPALIFALIIAFIISLYSGSIISTYELISYMIFIESLFIIVLIPCRLIILILLKMIDIKDCIYNRIVEIIAKK